MAIPAFARPYCGVFPVAPTIFDDGGAMCAGQRHEAVEIGGLAVQMDHDDRLHRPARHDRRSGIDVERAVGSDVDQHRRRARPHDRFQRRSERERNGEDGIAGADAERLQGELDADGNIVAPMLYFLDCCVDTIRTIPVLQHDETDTEDLDTDGEDHAADETRYAMMSRPWQPRAIPARGSGLPKLPGQHTINELIEKLRRQRIAASEA